MRIGSLLVVLSVLVLTGCQRPAVSPGHNFSLRIADHSPGPGMTETRMQPSGDFVYLSSANVLVASDIEKVSIVRDEKDVPALSFQVSKEAGENLKTITKDNLGKLLVVVIDDKPELAIPISSPFERKFWVTGQFTESDMDQFYSAVTGYD